MSLDVTGIGAVADLAGTVINKIWPDKSEQEKQQLAAAVMVIQGQMDINKNEALNTNVFVSGWRPFVGWVCGFGLIYSFIAHPLLSWASINFSFIAPPALDLSTLLTILGGMLGLGGLRTVEKIKGVSRS